MSDEDKPMPRRRFFREGLLELFKPLSRTIEPLTRAAETISALDQPPPPPPPPQRHWLRPPGSLPEVRFQSQCSRCGDCVRVCPSHAIKIDRGGDKGEGVPYIIPDESSCIMCTTLACMNNCPTGALQSTLAEYIDMGIAQWHESICLRSSGDPCTICADVCPVGAKAITIEDNKVQVKQEGCTGCGECQHQCPTLPKSITVLPKSAR